jgi:uncharacterized protein YbjQ (UPF0145 family)
MQLSTTKLENVKEVKSIVKGTAIYSEKYFDSFKSSVEIKKGGFLDIFALSTDKAINEAINELSAKAHDLEANAVQCIRINIQNIVSNSNDYITAVTVYGTAVIV